MPWGFRKERTPNMDKCIRIWNNVRRVRKRYVNFLKSKTKIFCAIFAICKFLASFFWMPSLKTTYLPYFALQNPNRLIKKLKNIFCTKYPLNNSICFLSKLHQNDYSSVSQCGKMDGNESIVVCQSSVEIDDVLDVGVAGSIGLMLFLGSITATGLIIKGIFVYYIKYAAPKERPINNMIFYDQVSQC